MNIPTLVLPTYEDWWDACPYGLWLCAGGREVLFNRGYHPILERTEKGPPKAANPGEWIKWEKHDEFFFNDWSAPWNARGKVRVETMRKLAAVLRDWGLPELPRMSRRRRREPLGLVSYSDFMRQPIPRLSNPWKDVLKDEMEKAMGPDPTKTGIFSDHRCSWCRDGELPCRQGQPTNCDYPRARND